MRFYKPLVETGRQLLMMSPAVVFFASVKDNGKLQSQAAQNGQRLVKTFNQMVPFAPFWETRALDNRAPGERPPETPKNGL